MPLTDGAAATLSPGIYVFQGGKFVVEKGASLEGDDLGLFCSSRVTIPCAAAHRLRFARRRPHCVDLRG